MVIAKIEEMAAKENAVVVWLGSTKYEEAEHQLRLETFEERRTFRQNWV